MIYFDFEYNDRQVLMCMARKVTKTEKELSYFDFRDDIDTQKMADYIKQNESEIFVSYAIAAEINSLLRLGIDVRNIKCVDLMAECKMITMSHDDYFAPSGSMLDSVRALLKKKVTETKAHKDAMRDLILDNEIWTEDEWLEIATYCESDLEDLPALFKKIVAIHKEEKHPFKMAHALHRGNFMRKATEMDFASKGFPVAKDKLLNIYKHKEEVKTSIVKALPPVWRFCYVKNKRGKWSLKRNLVLDVIKKNKWSKWLLTETGAPCLKSDYLKKLELDYPRVEPLRRAIKSLATLNSKDMSKDIVNGYIKPTTFGYAAKTGRNGLAPKRGYLLNLPSWMRKSITPHTGEIMIGSDWSQQEIAIAAFLSGDKRLEAAYKSGDVYLALGKMSGAIPEDGTKKTHPRERDMFKTLQLALAYGKGLKSLSRDFYNLLKSDGWSLIEASVQAKEVYHWHKQYFKVYWDWINNEVKQAKIKGWVETSDNWVCWVGKNSRRTQLLNFPSQSHGAVMMRLATFAFYDLWQAGEVGPVLCSQHDAFYFNSTVSKEQSDIEVIEAVMKFTGLGMIGIDVRSDTKVYTNEKGYTPDKWDTNDQTIWDMVSECGDVLDDLED